jgi:apolipoprotein D and lipocalin family protein
VKNFEFWTKNIVYIISNTMRFDMYNTIITMIPLIAFAGCSIFSSGKYAPLETVPSVDITKYVGKWYEIASLPFSLQDGCSCTTAEYEILESGVLKVTNSCRKEGEIEQATGKAFVVEGTNNSKLKVQFFWPFKGDYWVIDLADDYSYAVVGVPSRKYCWILSRSTIMSPETYSGILDRIKAKGFDITRFNKTEHNCK